VGYSLYKTCQLRDPYAALPTGVSAHAAPGFPIFVAAIYCVFGDGIPGSRALVFAEAFCIVLQIALIPLVVQAMGAPPVAGFIAGLFAIAGVQRSPEWEANYASVLLMLATLVGLRYWRPPGVPLGRRWALASGLGILWGAILLTAPSAATVWLTWLAVAAWLGGKQELRYAWLPILLLPVVLMLPWTIRNYRVLGGFVPLRSNLGLELRVSNNPCAAVSVKENIRTGCYHHPNMDAYEARKVFQDGEVQYNRAQMAEALSWIRQKPGSAAALSVQRVLRFWFPSDIGSPVNALLSKQNWLSTWGVYLATILSLPGIVFLFRENRAGAFTCATFLLCYPLTFYFLQHDPRYRVPILWVTFILAGVGVRSLVSMANRRLSVVRLVSCLPRI